MSKIIHLLLIDPQNDFCDLPAEYHLKAGSNNIGPTLPVAGAHQDMLRTAAFLNRVGPKLADIHVTLDSHQALHIAHPTWWMDSSGNAPTPFTVITLDDLDSGKWRARHPGTQTKSRAYVEALTKSNRYLLCVWPEHCLIGHWGHNVHPDVVLELDKWARTKLETIDFVTKGSNPFTEHYSAVQAEVPDANDPGSMLNTSLINILASADEILIAGEALSHCVANTVTDIANNFGEDNIKKMILLEDCSSSVTGFEQLGRDFVRDMTARGMKTAKSTDYLV